MFLFCLCFRYSGYCAWRGVFDFSGDENSETVSGIKREYPELGRCLYFDLAMNTHSVFYELINKKLNWIWYVNQPEPELKVNTNSFLLFLIRHVVFLIYFVVMNYNIRTTRLR